MPEMSDVLALFFEDCGGTPPLTLQVEHEQKGQARSCLLDKPFALLGREEGNDVCLPDLRVSRRHAYVQMLAGAVFCLDIGDRTGLRWDGQSARSGWLSPDRPVQIGPFILHSSTSGPPLPHPANPLAAGSLSPSSEIGWHLEVSGSGERTFRWDVDRVLTLLGSSAHCKLQLPAAGTSRFHCLFFCASSRLWVVDLLSREGTFVDGERIRWCSLEDGAVIRVGRLSIRAHKDVRCLPPPADPGPSREPAPLATQAPAQPPALSGGPLVPALPPLFLPPVLSQNRSDAHGEMLTAQAAWLAPFFQQINLMQQQMFEQMQQMMLFLAQTFSSLHQEQTAALRKELDELKRVSAELQTLQLELVREPSVPTATVPTPQPVPTPVPAPERTPPVSVPAAATNPPAAAAPAPLSPGVSGEAVHALLSQRIAELEQERKSRWQKILGLMKG